MWHLSNRFDLALWVLKMKRVKESQKEQTLKMINLKHFNFDMYAVLSLNSLEQFLSRCSTRFVLAYTVSDIF